MNVNEISAMANKLSIPQLQQALRDGSLPPYVGIPLLQQKVKMQQAAKNAQGAGQPKPPTVAEQVEGAAHQANMEDVMRQRAMAMQADMGQTGGISDFLPKQMAKGGVIAFAKRGLVPDIGAIYEKMANGETLSEDEKFILAQRPSKFAQMQKLPSGGFNSTQPQGVDIQAPAVQTVVPQQIQPIAQTNIGSNQPTTLPPTTNIGSNQPYTTAGGVLALPSAPAMTGFNGSEYDKALSGKESEEDYRKRMEGYLGPNTGIESLRGKLSKLEEESVADKEKAPWMALMKAGLATMAGTSPYALTNIGKGAQEGVADYIDAQKEFRKAQEKQFEIQSQLESAQRRERSDIYKYGAESKRADQANDRTVELAKAGAENQYKLHQLDNEVQIRGQNISAGNAANSLALQKEQLRYSEPYQRAQYADLYTKAQAETDPNKKAALEAQLKGMEQSHTALNQYAGLYGTKQVAKSIEDARDNYTNYLGKNGLTIADLPFGDYLKQMGYSPAEIAKITSGSVTTNNLQSEKRKPLSAFGG